MDNNDHPGNAWNFFVLLVLGAASSALATGLQHSWLGFSVLFAVATVIYFRAAIVRFRNRLRDRQPRIYLFFKVALVVLAFSGLSFTAGRWSAPYKREPLAEPVFSGEATGLSGPPSCGFAPEFQGLGKRLVPPWNVEAMTPEQALDLLPNARQDAGKVYSNGLNEAWRKIIEWAANSDIDEADYVASTWYSFMDSLYGSICITEIYLKQFIEFDDMLLHLPSSWEIATFGGFEPYEVVIRPAQSENPDVYFMKFELVKHAFLTFKGTESKLRVARDRVDDVLDRMAYRAESRGRESQHESSAKAAD